MTPKEKSKELVNVYLDITKRSLDIKGWFYDIDIAKQCALIAVDELIKAVESDWSFMEIRQDYWKEVKLEIDGI